MVHDHVLHETHVIGRETVVRDPHRVFSRQGAGRLTRSPWLNNGRILRHRAACSQKADE
ncbi:hypothetical protein D3C86_2032830 [compost metagenome]